MAELVQVGVERDDVAVVGPAVADASAIRDIDAAVVQRQGSSLPLDSGIEAGKLR